MNITVGILFAPEICFALYTPYQCKGQNRQGEYKIYKEGENVFLESNGKKELVILPLKLVPVDYVESEFELRNVTIGINFHWERKENQRFKGALTIIEEDGHLTAVNELDIEDYLLSVISSEMSASSSLELLKAHAVISRSWLIAQCIKAEHTDGSYQSTIENEEEYIRWFDREDHKNFDVCADDHCQRYQGISRATSPMVGKAIEATRGEVLMCDGKVCDARFSKCCGGVAERFENVWEPVSHRYLTAVYDGESEVLRPKDLTTEEGAAEWILQGNQDVFCNTTDKKILSEVLNDYDQETHHFYRWTVHYGEAELSNLIKERLGIDFGLVTALEPVERGTSGRIIRLRVKGTKRTMIIGKELIIRKALSTSHLYSSAFVVERTADGFTLHGAGWGHGVGLCQIGAAVMGARGYTYREILDHYFKGSELDRIESLNI